MFYPLSPTLLIEDYTVIFNDDDIKSLILSLNPNKSHGVHNISIRMILLCGDSIVTPLKLIFNNVLHTGIYPELWKYANVSPIHKKSDKQVVNNYRPISLLPICAIIFEKLLFANIFIL